MTVHPRARIVVNHCQEPGACLRKGFLCRFSSGNGEVAYFLEPGGSASAGEICPSKRSPVAGWSSGIEAC